MTLEEFYNAIGGSADNILERLGEESFIKKFIVKFLNDPTFETLKEDVETQNLDKANFDAHTLKGVCAVLDFVKLKELTEQFILCLKQHTSYEDIWQMLKVEYNLIIETIKMSNWEN
ncbi:MAG: Hpt domain-containing protein [Christensenellales bacterium]